MARKLAGKVCVCGTLVAQGPIAVGGAGADDTVDLELAVNGRGKFYVPGTSLCGPLRHWIATRYKDGVALAEAMFGMQKDDQGHASYLCVEDAVVALPPGLAAEIRDGIQIDRSSGTARHNKKYTRRVLPRGTAIPFVLELDLPAGEVLGFEEPAFSSALGGLLAALTATGIGLGGGKSRGMGRVLLTDHMIHVYTFPDDLDAWLDRLPAKVHTLTPREPDSEYTRIEIRIPWRAASGLMVKAGAEGGATKMLPLVSGVQNGHLAPVIPGSSIKGVLRAHAAKIVRTLWNATWLPPDTNDPDPDGAMPVIAEFFGSTEAAGRIRVADVYCQTALAPVEWLREDAAAMDAITQLEEHVAIDRFTGGASENALYNARPVRPGVAWDPIVLDVEYLPGRDGPDQSDACLALLLMVLRDLRDGYFGLGFGTQRGLGEIEIDEDAVSITITRGGATIQRQPGANELFGLPAKEIERLKNAWDALDLPNAACPIAAGANLP